ncbi:hypothetical protein FLJC2902T_06400 [Flavobacterium limnosediminis JC2902]|uniref:DUF2279 domain-containing protein n=1 Tax=Flavobacterium limnosediminis JC2902 TaxID=1341181 RepID=V6SS24_9FLAO|nr:DUF2279 domain-containing protein [Flavobacterium limnosediminis]ESU29244.1 hypothetical protein FLJC2902T_06400 [Flavobacterium limnosediminis JC2902]
MKNVVKLISLFFLVSLSINLSWGQSGINAFLKPSDTLNVPRRNAVIIVEGIVFAAGVIEFNQPFSNQCWDSDFDFINDNRGYMQMDKASHVFSSYHISRFSAEGLQWAGVSKKNQLIYGGGMGFVLLTTIELINGYKCESGASYGDIVANAVGSSLYISQELLWKEQRIVPKFSFHSSDFMCVDARAMKSQIMDDYNGQTYWMSGNLHSFFKSSKILPKWFNVALGYGVENFYVKQEGGSVLNSYRQLYFSLDVDLTRIKTNSHVLKTLFSVFNTIKVPAPTLEISQFGDVKGYFIYF